MLLLRRFTSGLNRHHHQALTQTLITVWKKPAIFTVPQPRSNLRRLRSLSISSSPMAGPPLPPAAGAEKSELLRALESSLGSPLSSEPLRPNPTPLVVVVSGPSGVGKDALIKKLTDTRDDLHFVVTATSRAVRPGEVDGRDYFFVTKEEFVGMIERDELLEHAVVYGDYKGIPKRQIREAMARGSDVVLRVDVQGAATLRRVFGDAAVFVFVVAESEAELVQRLVRRRTESEEALRVRVATAREEVKQLRSFDYVVVNKEGELDSAVGLVGSIIDAEKAKVRQRNAIV